MELIRERAKVDKAIVLIVSHDHRLFSFADRIIHMEDGEIIDVVVEYPDDFEKQMLYYSKNYSFLPTYN